MTCDDVITGSQQWEWLDKELSGSDAQIHLISSGTQILPYDKPIQEKWSHYPKTRDRLFDLIKKHKTPGAILLSGDVHYAEFLRADNVVGYPLWELTSSGMTHTCGTQVPLGMCRYALDWFFRSVYQVTDFFIEFNFGTIDFFWDAEEPFIQIGIKNKDNELIFGYNVTIDSLQPGRLPVFEEDLNIANMTPFTLESFRYIIFPLIALIVMSPWLCGVCRKKKAAGAPTRSTSTTKKVKKDQ